MRIKGTRDVTDDDLPGRPQLVLQLDAEALKNAGLDPAAAARLIRLHTEGEIVTEMRDCGDKIEVWVRGTTANQDTLTNIQQLLADPVALPGGTTTPGALVNADTRIGSGGIKHYNLKRAITIESDLDKTRIDTVEANARIATQWDAMEAGYPNTRIDFSGDRRHQREPRCDEDAVPARRRPDLSHPRRAVPLLLAAGADPADRADGLHRRGVRPPSATCSRSWSGSAASR